MLSSPAGSAATPRPRRTEAQRQLVLWRSMWRSEGRSWGGEVGLVAMWALRSEGRRWRGGIANGKGERREFSHFWPGVRRARPQLTGDLAVGLLGRAGRPGAEHGRPEVRPELSAA